MALAIVVEDGSGVPLANSYSSAQAVRDYAALRGIVLSADDQVLIPFMINAMDYLEAQADRYIGVKNLDTNPLEWPRNTAPADPFGFPLNNIDNVFSYGYAPPAPVAPPIANNLIPISLQQAQAVLTMLASAGTSLMTNLTGQFILSTQVGPLKKTFSEKLSGMQPSFPQVDALLAPLFAAESGFALTTSRG